MTFKSLISAAVLSCAAMAAQAQVVGIATLSQGSSFYAVGTAISGVMQQKANLTTRVQPMSGSSVYIPVLNRGEVEFAIASSLDVANAYLGNENFTGHKNPEMRLVGVAFVVPIGIAVANDSPIKSIKDLKGVRMPSQFTAQASMRLQQNAMLATSGLSTDDMKQYPVANYIKGMEALGADKVDAAMICIGCATALEANVALAAHGGLRLLPMPDTPEALAAMHKIFPSAYLQVFQPSAAVPGVVGPTRVMVYSGFLLSNAKVPEDVVYKATKAVYENKPMLEAATQYLKTFDPSAMAEASVVPYHPGAEKFYKEVGMWPPKKR
jgi:uncharacterized protein